MKISNYTLNNVNPNSCDELITTIRCQHYGLDCEGKVYTSAGELEKDHIVSAMVKMICTWSGKDGYNHIAKFYDSTAKKIDRETIDEFINIVFKDVYNTYKRTK